MTSLLVVFNFPEIAYVYLLQNDIERQIIIYTKCANATRLY